MATTVSGVEITGPVEGDFEEVLSDEAVAFVAELHRRFDRRRRELLEARRERQRKLEQGGTLDFLPETREIREGEWQVAPPPPDLRQRRVEITGPTDAKMVINALNSGADGFMTDFEDSNSPTWKNMIQGQPNPNAERLMEKGSGPYFYLPKMESHLEARLWNEVFTFAQEDCGIPHGTIKGTVLIETIPAAFEMEEILYELRDHSAGLNAGRWDYIFSVIKKFRDRGADFVLPERNAITMTAPFMRAYTELLVRTCHKRGAHAIGGIAAFIPSRKDEEVNKVALEKVRADKTRESGDGFDGSWVAHPDLVPVCREVFDGVLGDKPNQRDRLREDVSVSAADLLNVKATPGDITEAGLRGNVDVALRYLATWLNGSGAVAIHNLMEDAATAEISRSQVWQWIYNGVSTAEGKKITK